MKRTIDFIKSRGKYLMSALLIALIFFLIFKNLSDRYILAFTKDGHYCLPYSTWLIIKGEKPGRGDYVSFVGHGIPHFADGVRWVKIMSGLPGDRVRTVTIPDSKRAAYVEVLEVNGLPVQKRLQGRVYLQTSSSGHVTDYRVFETDTLGRSLPIIDNQTIPPGHFFVSTQAPRSFDSRYWGLIDEKEILGKAYPIF
ncbi:MAG: S26 family signal peptidase [Syntrophus sp. (in: bacteria)]|jgi:conjugal transfer pilin signal peptidase TrbI